ncbi:MAG: hypothetical protein AAB345_00795 [Patescibacteria group bacterium]
MIIVLIVLLVWILVLSIQTKEIKKTLDDVVRWSAYLETVIKDSQILVLNPEKGKHGEYEVNKKIAELLK